MIRISAFHLAAVTGLAAVTAATITSSTSVAAVGSPQVSTPATANTVVLSTADTTGQGWYRNEAALSVPAVQSKTFGRRWSASVNGQVYAPLVRAGTGTVIAATENDDVEAFTLSNGARLWQRTVGKPWPTSTINCTDLTPNVGVTGRPVLSPDGSFVYLVAKTYAGTDTAHPSFFLHALSVATGAERTGWPVKIGGAADNDPAVTFNPLAQLQRPGLLLLNGVVYMAFGSLCDNHLARGWIAGVSTVTAKQTALWTTEAHATASNPLGSVWQSAGELVSDRPAQIIFATGNGQTPPVGSTTPTTLANADVRLTVGSTGKLAETDYFAPFNADALNTMDQDLGSGAPTLLPSTFGTVSTPSIIAQGGKAGYVYVLNAGALGHRGATSNNLVQTLGQFGRVFSQPAAYSGDGGYMYLVTTGPLVAFKNAPVAGKPHLSRVGQSAAAFGFSSSSPVVTSNGTTPGTALVWIVQSANKDGTNANLLAFKAVPSGGVLLPAFSASIGTAVKFGRPLVADNRVLVGTRTGTVIAFGTP